MVFARLLSRGAPIVLAHAGTAAEQPGCYTLTAMTPPNIDSIEIRRYRLPLDPPFSAAWDPEPRHALESTVVRVRSSEHEGVGSGTSMAGFAGYEPLFLGRDPFDVERHAAVLDNLQFYEGRMWALEIALWDLMGQIEGVPLWRMLGGASGRVRVYASTGERLSRDERVASALRLRDEGFSAIKLRMFAERLADDLEVVRAVRDAVGPEMAIMVDANQGWRVPHDTSPSWGLGTALDVAKSLRELDVHWLEEPLHRHDYAGLAELRRRSGLAIAGGEGARELGELRQYIRHGSLDVYQPDVAWSTGIVGARQLASELRDAGAVYTPHTWGDGLLLLANLHVAAALSDGAYVEFPYDPPTWTPDRRDFLLSQPITADGDGYVSLPDRPGLGTDIDWDSLEALRL